MKLFALQPQKCGSNLLNNEMTHTHFLRKSVWAIVLSAFLGGCSTVDTPTTYPPIDTTTPPTTDTTIPPDSTGGTTQPELLDVSSLLGRTDVNGESWLLNQSPSAYTVQVIAVQDLATIKKFLPSQSVENMAIFKELRNGQPVYKVVYGIFANANEADVALRSLPEWIKAQGTQPWKVSISEIQEKIKTR